PHHPQPALRQALAARPAASYQLSETASVSCWPSRPWRFPSKRGSPPRAAAHLPYRRPRCITPCPPHCRLRARTSYRVAPMTPEPATLAVDLEGHLPTQGSGATPRNPSL